MAPFPTRPSFSNVGMDVFRADEWAKSVSRDTGRRVGHCRPALSCRVSAGARWLDVFQVCSRLRADGGQ
eukprot:6517909-Pyramimonas_sp.AAC.1